MSVLYNALLLPLALLALPFAALWLLRSPRLRTGLGERFRPLARRDAPTTWVHAASVGEVEAARPLIEALLARGEAVVATTLTDTGRARLHTRLPDLNARLAPLDLPGLVHASLRRARVRALVLIETELWPNLLSAAAGAGLPVAVVSARVSDRSFPRYRRLRFALAPLLSRLAAVGARSQRDAERFVALGARAEAVRVTGDLKLAAGDPPVASPELVAALGPGPLLLGGSTHPGEEHALLEAWQHLRGLEAPTLRLVLAPRHVERSDELEAALRATGVRVGRRSRADAAGAEVVLLDTTGELAACYALAELVFVGGSLAPVGGHNLLEPVRAGRVVVCGPALHNQRNQVDLLEPLGVLRRVRDRDELARALAELWKNGDRHDPARAARAELARHDDALARTLELLEQELGRA